MSLTAGSSVAEGTGDSTARVPVGGGVMEAVGALV
jgi:hypothetical protein